METAGVNNMSADKIKKIENDVKEIHTQIKKSNLVLRQRIKDIQQEMVEWDSLGGLISDENHNNGYMPKE
jgi:hypothetical protein